MKFETEVRRLPLDDVRSLLFSALDRRPESAKTHGMGSISYGELRSRAAAASTFEELFGAVREFDTIPKELL